MTFKNRWQALHIAVIARTSARMGKSIDRNCNRRQPDHTMGACTTFEVTAIEIN